MNSITPPLRYGWRRLRRGWRSGELLILALALLLAVAAAGSVSLFTERVRSAIAAQAGDALGADLIFISRRALPADLESKVLETGARTATLVNLPSVVFAGEQSALAAIKAASPGYPLRGTLRVADEAYAVERVADGIPAPGTVWVDPRLWIDLQLQSGSKLLVGGLELSVTQVLTFEPDRGGGFTDLAPRILMHAADLPATQLVQPGSRMQQTLMVAGTAAQLAQVRRLELAAGVRRSDPAEARPELGSALERAGQFLDLAILAALLLAAAAIALCARSHGLRLRDEVALLKCLGAGQNFIVLGLTATLLLLGLLAGLAGAVLGWFAQELIATLLSGLLQVQLPAASPWPLAGSMLLGLVLLLAFAAPPLLEARRVPPVRVFQRAATGDRNAWTMPAAAVAGVVAVLWLQAGEFKLALFVLAGAAITMGSLALLAWLLVRLLAPLKRSVGTAWRFGLGNLSRRQGSTVAQAVAIGLALLALLMVGVAREDLLVTWKSRLAPETPNQFLINILPEQVEPLRTFLAQRGKSSAALMPMVRGRLVALNGKTVSADDFEDPRTQRWVNREFNLSRLSELRSDNKLLRGQWWTPAQHGEPLLSVDRYVVERLQVDLGDRLTLQMADQQVELTISSIREVEWDSFQPNFFLLVPPGTLDGAPATWLSSFHLAPEERGLLRELVQAYPNVTALDLEALMQQVRGIIDRVVRAVEFIFLFTLAAGMTVLLAAIEGTRDERVREVGLLRALGARTSVILQGLLAEYLVLGLLAGAVAAIAAQSLTWVLAEQVFRIPYGPRPLLWLVGTGSGAAVVTLMGWLSLRSTLKTRPFEVLRAN